MRIVKRYKPIDNSKLSITIFILCWIAYFSTYIGRLNYSAAMTQMINDNFVSKMQGGLIGTYFFACYGIGQFFNGFIGDRMSPFKMIFIGIFFSAACNLVMAFSTDIGYMYIIWGINGLVQSMIWSPIVRIFSQLIPSEHRFRACVHLNSTVPAGTLCAYLLSTLMISLTGWRGVFGFASVFLFVISLVWMFYVLAIRKNFEFETVVPVPQASKKGRTGFWAILFVSGIFFILFPTAIHGMLKDGITTWFPTYLIENYKLAPNISILLTTILPIFNLTGAYFASWLNSKYKNNDLKTVGVMFGISAMALALLALLGSYNMYLSIILAAIATSTMFGVNSLIISILPMYFGKIGLASTVTGILNSSTYIGCAISMGLFGAIMERYSWFATIAVWCLLAIIGVILSFAISGKWKSFKLTINE